MEFSFQHQDWDNISVLGRNRLPVRPFYCGFHSEKEALNMREEESGNVTLLNGRWKFSYYKSPFSVPEEVTGKDYDDSGWDSMPVPGHWQLNGYDFPCYNDAYALFPVTDDPVIQADNPTGVYRRSIQVEKKKEQEYILRFDGVESAYHVWVNGIFTGYSQGSRNTAEFDITDKLKDGENTLAVEVYKFCDGSYLENQDMWWFSGIIRDVSLITRPKLHLLDYKIDSLLEDDDRNGRFRMKAEVENHTGQEVKFSLETRLLREMEEGEPEEIYLHSCGMETKNGRAEIFIDETVGPVDAWSAETPKLYTVLMSLKAEGETVEAYSCRIGFRTIELRDGLFFINGSAIKLKGVNRHDWNEYTGRCITREDMITDLYLMKQNNINAVRTAHYPPSPYFLELCDRLGFYVVEEADLECNQMAYTGKMNRLSDAVLWEESYIDRAERMVRRDKNHPSVIIWSLGNESGFGTAFVESGKFVRKYDPTRLIHYEEDRDASVADVYSTMYTRHHELEMLGKDTTKTKPHIVCEYAHAMGNGPGGLKEYWEIFEKYPRLQGGFIWEWIDHGIKKTDEKGTAYYTYGGDYGDYPNSGAFCCDGLYQADRRPTPAVLQVKKVLEPVRFEEFDPQKGTIVIQNKYDFITLKHLRLILTIHGQERVLLKKEMDLGETPPQGKETLSLFAPEEIHFPDQTEDWWMDLSVVYRDKPLWAGEEIQETAFHQELLMEAENQLPCGTQEGTEKQKLKVSEKNKILTVEGEEFTAQFDCIRGNLTSYSYGGEELLKDGLGMNFWRAPVDNDKNAEKIWEEAMLKAVCSVTEHVSVEEQDGDIVIQVKQFYAPIILEWKVLVKALYRIEPDGHIEVEYHGIPVGNQLPCTTPRIGLRFVLSKECEEASWYGRGPLETYPDCKEGNRFGYFKSNADSFYFPYVVPQETGNHEDTKWVLFQTKSGRGIRFSTKETFGFSALHYTQEELTRALHTNELHRTEDIILCLDYRQHGLGSASWGAECLEKDRLHPEEFLFRWEIKGQK